MWIWLCQDTSLLSYHAHTAEFGSPIPCLRLAAVTSMGSQLTTSNTGWQCDIISAGHIDGADYPCPSNWLACLDSAKNSKTDKKLQATILHLKCQTGSYIWHQSISNLKFPFFLSTEVVSLEHILLDCSEIHRFLLHASGEYYYKSIYGYLKFYFKKFVIPQKHQLAQTNSMKNTGISALYLCAIFMTGCLY